MMDGLLIAEAKAIRIVGGTDRPISKEMDGNGIETKRDRAPGKPNVSFVVVLGISPKTVGNERISQKRFHKTKKGSKREMSRKFATEQCMRSPVMENELMLFTPQWTLMDMD
jgi:hypothetical protein